MTSTGSGEQPSAACPHCGSLNPQAFRFCGTCGKPVERECPVCGRPNPGGFRFCGYCGSQLEADVSSAAPALEERKIVTVLFADLAASTELAARLDPEDLRGVLRPYFGAMAGQVARYGGTVEKFIGDAVVAVFGAPVAHEDDPVRAIRCALAMRARLEELNEELSERGIRLSLRIGVNTGEVVADPGADGEGIVTGEAVNIASRFQVLAPPGGIVVGERTQRDARHIFGVRPMGEVSVKGLEHPLPAWEVVGLREERPREALQAPLVGREEDLELLNLLMDRTVRGGGSNLVTVTGPAGIGKSRLTRELVTRVHASRRKARVVKGRCLPYGEGLTYWPLGEILKGHTGILDSDPQAVMLEKARKVLQEDLEEGWRDTAYVLLSSIGFPVPANPLEGADPEAARVLILGSWRRYLEAMAKTDPLLAVVEDIHWADRALLDLLEGLASTLRAPVFLLCLARPELGERRPGWGGGLSNATTITLSPLDRGEGRELVGHLLGEGAPEDVVAMVLERAEGNPFFAEELLRMLIEDGTLVWSDGSWTLERQLPASLPDTVQGVVAARIDLLSSGEKRAVQEAAVVGRVFWRGAVTALGSPGEAVDALVRKGLVREQPSSTLEGDQELAFTHILIRDVAYQSIPKARRRDLHAAVGGWLEGVTEGREEEFAEIFAHHFELAGDLGRTARYAMLAGLRKLRVFAAEEALPWFDRALGAEADRGSPRVPGEILVHRGSAHEQLARFPEAQTDYEAAIKAARGLEDASLEARALAALAHINWLQDRYEEGRRITRAALEKAREAGAPHLLGRILYTAGTNAFGQASWGEAERFHREALEVAEREGDTVGTALAHHGICETLCFMGGFEASLDHGRRSAELFRDLGQRLMLHHNDHMIGWALIMLGRLDEAMRAYEAGAAGSHEVGDRRSESVSVTGMATVSFLRGDLGEALARLRDAYRIAEDLEAPRVPLIVQGSLLPALVELRAWDRLEDDLEAALALSDALETGFLRPRMWAVRGCLAMVRDDEDPEPLFARARTESEDSGFEALWAGLVELLAREMAGEADVLERTAARLVALADPEAAGFRVWGLWGRALAASLRRDHDESERMAANTLEAARGLGMGPLAWRALSLHSRSLESLGRGEEARPAAAEATRILEGLAAGIGEEALRRSFTARPEVAALLGG